SSISCGGAPQKLELQEDGTVARLRLARSIAAGQSVTCDIVWHAQIPEIIARAGYAGDFHMITQGVPNIGVWNGREWEGHVYCARCEFFADFGVYDVEITVPDKYVVGASGLLVRSERKAGKRTDVYRAEDVHDFAWAASPAFRERTETADARPGL